MRRRSQDGSKPPFLHSMEDPARLLKRAEALRTAPVYGAESLDDSPRRFSIYHTIDLPQREKPTTMASSKTLHPVKRDADAVKRAERSRSFTGSRPLPVDHSKDPPLPKYKPYHSCQEENRHGRRPAAPSPTVDMIPARRRSSVRTVTLIKEACVQEIPSRQPEVHKSDPSGRRHGVHSFKESVTATHHDSHRTLKKSQVRRWRHPGLEVHEYCVCSRQIGQRWRRRRIPLRRQQSCRQLPIDPERPMPSRRKKTHPPLPPRQPAQRASTCVAGPSPKSNRPRKRRQSTETASVRWIRA